MTERKPARLSAVMKQLAETCLVHPVDQSTLQAFATSLLFAQIGWNSALGHDMGQLESVLLEIERDNPALWDELRSRDPAVLIAQVRAAKLRQHPDDDRVIVVCGVIDEVIRVEWCRQADFPALQERLGSPLAPVGVVCRKPTTARTRPAFTAPAARRWRELGPQRQTIILNQVWCGGCGAATAIVEPSGRIVGGDLLLEGTCLRCGGAVARVVEGSGI